MKRKFTFLIAAAVMLLTMMATTGEMWGQSRTTKTYKLTITASNFNTTSYPANNNEKTTNAVNVSDNTDTYEVKWTSYQVMKISNNMQWQKSKGYIYNSTDLGTITSVTVTSSAGSFTTYYGTSAQPSSGTSGSGKGYFKTNVGGATGTTSKVEIVFEIEEGGPTQLDTPTNFAASPGNAQATFTWDEVDNAESYTISYTTDGETWTDIENIVETSYTKTGLTNGTEYTCKIKAVGDGEDYSDSDYSSTITVTPTSATYYNVNITSPLTGGSVSASAATATSGTTITLTATPSAGYTFNNIASNWTVTDGSKGAVTVTPGEGNTATFTMPASDVTVSATFTAMPVYTVTCTTPANGTLSASPTSGYNGVEVTITATPSSGYELATLTATDSEGEITITDNKFNIRNSNVTVVATFTAAIVYEWVPVAIGDLTGSDIFVIVGNNGSNYAMTNDKGTSKPPLASAVTITNGKLTSTVADNMKWNISGNANDGYTFYPNGTTETWLYCTNTNNGVRVGTNANKTFKIDHDYLQNQITSRYVGIYNSSDWRCYTSYTTDNIKNQSFAFYKRIVPASVATPVFSVAAGTYNTNQSVTITCATDGATIYYTTDGSEPTNLSSKYTEPVSITQTTTLKAIAIKNAESSNVASATYTLKCATPTFSPVGGSYTSVQSVTITCATDGASIYYTTDGSTPTSSSTAYSSAISIDETTTLKAIAIKSNWSDSDVASATYTIELPLSTMQAIFDRATAVGNTATNVNITLGGWVVSGVSTNGKNVFVTDGTKGFVIYDKDASMGFTVGNILTGTVACKVQLYNGFAELTNLNSSTTGISIATGGVVGIADIAMADLTGVNTGALISYNDLTYSSSGPSLSNGATNIKPYTSLYDYGSTFTDTKKYHVTGIFQQYSSTKQIHPRSAADIVLAADMSATDLSGLTAFSYVVDNGPSAAQHIELYGEDFAGDLTVTASGDYEVSTDNTTYSESVVVAHDEGDIAEDLYVRLKSGLATGDHNGTLTFTATNLTTVEQALEGTVTASASYTITLNQNTGGTISADKETAEAGETVTLSVDVDDCYNFTGWTVLDGLANEITVTNNQFTMPDSDVEVDASFTQKTFVVTYSFNGEDIWSTSSISCGNTTDLLDEDDLETLEVVIPSGFYFQGWSEAQGSTTLVSSPYTPTSNITLYAVLTYGETETYYARVTSDLGTDWAGDYLIAYSDEIFADGRVGGTGNNGIGKQNVSANLSSYISGNNIPATNGDTYKVTLEEISENSNTYVLKTQDGKYNYQSSNNNGLVATDNKTTAAAYPITVTFTSENDIKLCLGGAAAGAVFRYNTGGYFRYYANGSQKAVYLYKRTASEAPNFNVVTVYNDPLVPEPVLNDPIPETTCVIVGEGITLTFNGDNNGTAANLVIEDGGQLVFNGTGVQATMKKKTVGESKAEHWYTIASPVNNIDFANITNLTNAATFDLYRYDEATYTWENYKNTAHTDFVTAENGRGYLYYNSNGNELSFAGELNNSASYDLTASGAHMNGLNLIGNPFTQNITLANISLSDDAQISEGFYVLSNNSDWVASVTTVKPCEGFIVKVNKATTATFSKSTGSSKSRANRDYIAFTVANNQYEDVAYAMFSNGLGLDKIDHRNAEIPMVYIPQNGQNYAIATMSDDTEMFNLNFKAMTTGQYTLSFKAQGSYSYLHIYDKMTNEDVDMLLEGGYSFIGSPRDAEDRFVVRLSYRATIDGNDTNNIFAYQSGSDIIVSGNGELQVFDVNGRMVMNTVINGKQTVNIPTTGLYIFRMVGESVKTQKIVVR